MILPGIPERYDPKVEEARNGAIEAADRLNRKKRTDLTIYPPERLVLYSPDGSKFAVVVDNAGVLSTVPA
jgi:hypothetical protein